MDIELLFWYIIDGLTKFEIPMIIFVIKSLFHIGFLLGTLKMAYERFVTFVYMRKLGAWI